MLKIKNSAEVAPIRREAISPETLVQASLIVADVRDRGEVALREHAERLGDVDAGAALLVSKNEMRAAWEALPSKDQAMLQRAAGRITAFARAQRATLADLEFPIAGGLAGHRVTPVERAGCYAPGGRYPLPSSVLMTALTARAAGVEEVWLASPRPTLATLAAAHLCGVDGFLCVGGAQAIAALAYGVLVPAADAVVGPGNRWVTAAKQLVSGHVAIDMLAGPSELVVLADQHANPAILAADLLAQAEHDDDAVPILVTDSRALVEQVDQELARQLATLPTRATAERALQNGYAVVCQDLEEAVEVTNRLSPEHLEVQVSGAFDPAQFRHFGGLFIGEKCAEVFGDYGAGPNHTLPTGGTARSAAGLSVFTFLRVQTWMTMTSGDGNLIEDTARFARMEGLEAHARSAEMRSDQSA